MINASIVPTHIHYNIEIYTSTTSPDVSHRVRPWHYFYRNFLPLHQTWSDLDLVLCGLLIRFSIVMVGSIGC